MNERRLLQVVVSICVLVPILGGGTGVLYGAAMVWPMVGNGAAPAFADSHFRYLSGLLLAIGLGFLSTVPNIEARSGRFRLLAAIVFVGGLGRLLPLVLGGAPGGAPDASIVFALAMELGVTPTLALWQYRVARMAKYRAAKFQAATTGG
jgi:hypothetical protein